VDNVLGLARTGLIFTGFQEGAQPGGGGWPHLAKQSLVFHTMWRPAGFGGCWGGGAAGTLSWLGSLYCRSCLGELLCGVVRFFLCIPLICIVVVAVSLCLLFC